MWFDEWEIKPGDSILVKIEDGLEHSRVLVLCTSSSSLAPDWPQLESHSFRFKDPLNHDRRLIPLRLDDAPLKGSLVLFSYIDWRPDQPDTEYSKLVKAIRRTQSHDVVVRQSSEPDVERVRCTAPRVDSRFGDKVDLITPENHSTGLLWHANIDEERNDQLLLLRQRSLSADTTGDAVAKMSLGNILVSEYVEFPHFKAIGHYLRGEAFRLLPIIDAPVYGRCAHKYFQLSLAEYWDAWKLDPSVRNIKGKQKRSNRMAVLMMYVCFMSV